MDDIRQLIDGGFINQSIDVKGINEPRKGLFVTYFKEQKMNLSNKDMDEMKGGMIEGGMMDGGMDGGMMDGGMMDGGMMDGGMDGGMEGGMVMEGFTNPEEKDLTYKDDFKNLIKSKTDTSTNNNADGGGAEGGGVNVLNTVSNASNLIGKTVRQLLANPVAFSAIRLLTFVISFYIAFFIYLVSWKWIFNTARTMTIEWKTGVRGIGQKVISYQES